MTTIAYRDGVMAADRGVTMGQMFYGRETKIHRVAGLLVGIAGSNALSLSFLRFLKVSPKPDMLELPKLQADKEDCLVALSIDNSTNGIGFWWTTDAGQLIVDYIHAEYLAAGSGKEIATGAFAQGATAEEAVECAIKHNIYTEGPIDTLMFENQI